MLNVGLKVVKESELEWERKDSIQNFRLQNISRF